MTASGQPAPAAVFGGGGHARSVADVLARLGRRVALVVAPRNDGIEARDHQPHDEAGINAAAELEAVCFLAVGDNARRLAILAAIEDRGLGLPALIARSATVAADADLAAGVVVLEHAHVGPRSRLGEAAIINTGAVIDHDATLGEGTHIAVGAILAGEVRCGRSVLVGAGATVLPGITIGDGAVVGAGAVVVGDVRPGTTVVGSPARAVEQK